MKLIQSAGALLLLASSSMVFAANLSIPMSFEYLALDGQTIETNKFTHKKDLALNTGTHKIAIRYHDIVNDEFSDSQSFIKSAPFIVTLVVDGDHKYTLAPSQGVIKQPNQFAKNPQITISREDKQATQFSVVQTQIEESSFFGQLFANKSEPVVADSTQIAATESGAQTHKVASVVTALPSNKDAQQGFSNALASETQAAIRPQITAQEQKADPKEKAQQMLQYWWLQADEKTRKEFMGWAIQQL